MDTDIKVTINLNKIVENRIKQMGAYRDFAEKSVMGTLVSTSDIDEIVSDQDKNDQHKSWSRFYSVQTIKEL